MIPLDGRDLTMNLIGSSQAAPGASLDKVLSHTFQEIIKEETIQVHLLIFGMGRVVSSLETRVGGLCP